MLGIIIFLLTFCTVGNMTEKNDKNLVWIFALIVNFILGVTLTIIYFIFFK